MREVQAHVVYATKARKQNKEARHGQQAGRHGEGSVHGKAGRKAKWQGHR